MVYGLSSSFNSLHTLPTFAFSSVLKIIFCCDKRSMLRSICRVVFSNPALSAATTTAWIPSVATSFWTRGRGLRGGRGSAWPRATRPASVWRTRHVTPDTTDATPAPHTHRCTHTHTHTHTHTNTHTHTWVHTHTHLNVSMNYEYEFTHNQKN